MPRRKQKAILFDGDNSLPDITKLSRNLHVVFLSLQSVFNLQSTFNDKIIDEITKIDEALQKKGCPPVQVVLCDNLPEAVDLAILLWRQYNQGYEVIRLVTDDGGLKWAFAKRVVPARHGNCLPKGGPGLRNFPLSTINTLSSVRDIIKELAGDAAEQAYDEMSSQHPKYPWWARLAYVARQCPAVRLAFPLGIHGKGAPGDALATWAKDIFSDHLSSPPSMPCEIPDLGPQPHLLPLRGQSRAKPIRATPGLLQVQLIDPTGSALQYDWVALKRHCSEGIQQLINLLSSGGEINAKLENIENMLTSGSVIKLLMPSERAKLPIQPTVCVTMKDRGGGMNGWVRAKRLDFTAYPSPNKKPYSLSNAVKRWITKAITTQEWDRAKRQIDAFLGGSSLELFRRRYEVIPEVNLYPIEDPFSNGQFFWEAFFLDRGDQVKLQVTRGNPVQIGAGSSLISVAIAQTERRLPPQEVLGLMRQPTIHYLLSRTTSNPVVLKVARCIHPLAYELVAPPLAQRGERP